MNIRIETETLPESSIHLLNEAVKCLPNSPATNILKTYYSIKCRTISFSSSLSLPQRFIKETVRCPRCCVEYQETKTKYQIKPEQKQSKFARKLLKTHKDEKSLTKYQQKYLKDLIKKEESAPHNFLQITCSICNKSSKKSLLKSKEEAHNVTTPQTIQKSSNRKKNRTKKDRYFGLKMEAVLSANTTPLNINSTCNESFSTDDFIPLVVTPKRKNKSIREKKNVNKKNCLPHHQKMFDKIEKSKNKKIQKKNKQKQLKGLQNILNNSKQKSNPSATLKNFLTSI